MSDTVRLGFIGAGDWARRRLLPTFRSISGVQLVAVANRSLASSERVTQEFNIPIALDNWRALVARDDLNAIVVGTPPYFHREAVTAALEAGKHVLCVPRLRSVQDAREMQNKARETGLKLMIFRTPAARIQQLRKATLRWWLCG